MNFSFKTVLDTSILSTYLSYPIYKAQGVSETLLGKFKNKFAFRHYRRLGNAMEDAVFKGEIHPLNPRELVPRNSTKIVQTTIHEQEGYLKCI